MISYLSCLRVRLLSNCPTDKLYHQPKKRVLGEVYSMAYIQSRNALLSIMHQNCNDLGQCRWRMWQILPLIRSISNEAALFSLISIPKKYHLIAPDGLLRNNRNLRIQFFELGPGEMNCIQVPSDGEKNSSITYGFRCIWEIQFVFSTSLVRCLLELTARRRRFRTL